MKILLHLSNGYIFEDQHKTFSRLNIAAHSKPYFSGARTILIDNREYTVFDTHLLLKNFLRLRSYIQIRLISCCSAEGGSESFAAQLSRFYPRKSVKGYAGKVYTEPKYYPEHVQETVKKLDVLEKLTVEKEWYDFHSVTYKNGLAIKSHIHAPYCSCLDCFPRLS